MKEFTDKISSYHFLTSIIPGTLFSFLIDKYTTYNLIQENIFEGAILYYFIGLTLNRVGSLCVQPLFRRLKIIEFEDYTNYIEAEKKDPKISLLTETNNMYRSLISALLVFLIIILIDNNLDWGTYLYITFILIIYIFSYRKQTNFITSRIINENNK